MAEPTIQNILALPSPNFTVHNVFSHGARSRGNWQRILPRHVRQWDDFNLNNISSAYGDLLGQPAWVAMNGLYANRVARNISEMKDRFIEWLLKILESPVATGSRLLGRRLGSANVVHHSQGTAVPRVNNNYEPCLVFYLDTMPRTHIVVSSARLSSHWTSEDLKDQEPASLLPLWELATYAKESGTRYSFIMTDKEVVVVRFMADPSGRYGA
ncbi:hypothetical protein LCI18_000436 [Fusarium solani-melongenae]|uniref:Uncharacterized protein n=1 Tax=Fusarium solani subsp. cucurbitae TaxID=2747967 RepID=A0ACD3YKR0_FUSSC|nr:hypothetical protein LCI18_000436 [Fusarium solani-melongenae]